MQNIGIGIGAGLVSALLFGMLLKGTPLALVLYLLAPLPILIVGLGWSSRAALAAAIAGSLALALVVGPFLGLGFAAYLALPAWWLAYLALLGRPNADGSLEWYPTGRLLGWTGATAALAFIAIAVMSSPSHEAFQAQIRGLAGTIVKAQMRDAPARPNAAGPNAAKSETTKPDAAKSDAAKTDPNSADATGSDAAKPEAGADAVPGADPSAEPLPGPHADLADALARVVPAFAANGLALLLTFYLWASARIVQLSGRLPRPWPDIPATVMPRAMIGLLAVAVILSFAPGYAGTLGMALVGSVTAVFALQGLAAFHDRSRGRPARGAMLLGLYLILFFTQGIALIVLTLFGLADTALDRRGRRDRATP